MQLHKLIPTKLVDSYIDCESKILIITSDISSLNSQNIVQFFTLYGILNFVFIYEENNDIKIQKTEMFNGDLVQEKIINNKNLAKRLFPDKLKNLNGYKYRIIMATSNLNRTNRIVQRISRLFRAIKQTQNSGRALSTQNNFEHSSLLVPYGNRKNDFLVSDKINNVRDPNSILMYNRNTFCASIPKVKRFTKLK